MNAIGRGSYSSEETRAENLRDGYQDGSIGTIRSRGDGIGCQKFVASLRHGSQATIARAKR